MTRDESSPLFIYEDIDKAVEVRLDTAHKTVWLTQAQMAELFDVKPQYVTMHLKNVYAEGRSLPRKQLVRISYKFQRELYQETGEQSGGGALHG